MVCETRKIDSNITGLAIAEEVCPKQLPIFAVDGYDPVWFGQEPNSYSDFGNELTTVTRAPIDPSRQNKKGTVTDQDASGGYNTDFTRTNLSRLLQGFLFADARRKPSTESFALGISNTLLTSVDGASKEYRAAAGLLPFNKAGFLVFASGFGVASNNGLKSVVSSTATAVVVNEVIVNEAAPPAKAKLDVCGYQFLSGVATLGVTGGFPSLLSSGVDLTTLGLTVGEWIWIGGDAAGNQFVSAVNRGYARISTIAAGAILFDETTFTAIADAGTAKTLRIFFGTVIRNEKLPALIKKRSYQLERTLGVGPEAENTSSLQAEYLEGAFANEFTLNIPQAEKLNADLTFVAMDYTTRNGAAGAENKIKSSVLGTYIPALGEDAFNTSSDIYRIKMSERSAVSANPLPLFSYLSEATISISNGVTPNKAVGYLGAIDTSAGNFVVGGSLTAYFQGVNALRAVRNNADVQFNVISAAKNVGMVFDVPLLGLGGGRVNVEKDAPITVPLEPAGAENANGYTMLVTLFPYLPTVAMPV